MRYIIRQIWIEVSLFTEALYNQIPYVQRKRQIAYEKRQVRRSDVYRTMTAWDKLPDWKLVGYLVENLSDQEFKSYIDEYFANEVSQSLAVAVSNFLCIRELPDSLKE